MAQRILIIKTSSIGDILQAFHVLPYLKEKGFIIDFVIDYKHKKLAYSHPYITNVIITDFDGWSRKKKKKVPFSFFRKTLRKTNYDMVFDLQQNWKSSLVLFFVKAKRKIGYGRKTVREKINLLFTKEQYEVSKAINIRLFYLKLFEHVLGSLKTKACRWKFFLNPLEEITLNTLVQKIGLLNGKKILVAIGSFWKNKVPSSSFSLAFLQEIEKKHPSSFIIVYGSDEEKNRAEFFASNLKSAIIVEKMSFTIWHHLFSSLDVLITTDSSMLSLAHLGKLPSFSFFGPTRGSVFSSINGSCYMQGQCPFSISFEKQCPYLRSCKSGDCIKKFQVKKAVNAFDAFLKSYHDLESV